MLRYYVVVMFKHDSFTLFFWYHICLILILGIATYNLNNYYFMLERLDKTRFHVIGAVLFTIQSGILHPTAVVKTRMQVAEAGLSHMHGFSVFKRILKYDGIPGVYRGFGTSAIGSLPGRMLCLTSLEMSKDMTLKYAQDLDLSEATRIASSNAVAGLVSNVVSCGYFVPLDVVSCLYSSIKCFY